MQTLSAYDACLYLEACMVLMELPENLFKIRCEAVCTLAFRNYMIEINQPEFRTYPHMSMTGVYGEHGKPMRVADGIPIVIDYGEPK